MLPSTRAGVAPGSVLWVAAVIWGAAGLGACRAPASVPASPPRPADPPPAPYAPGLAPVDANEDPCVDFEVFACGNRLYPRGNLGRSGDLVAHRNDRLSELVAQMITQGQSDANALEERPLRNYLARCADPESRAAGVAELRSELEALNAAASMTDLARSLGRLRAYGPGILIDFTPIPRQADGKVLGSVRVGLVDPILPRRFYPAHEVVREYRVHWETLAALSGAATAADAEAATRVDAWLAEVRPVPSDDPATLGPFERARLERRRFPWAAYLEGFAQALGRPVAGPFTLYDPGDLRLVDGLLTLPFGAIKSYARILLIERWAELVTRDLLDEELRFHNGTVHGLVIRGSKWTYADTCVGYLPRLLFTSLLLVDLKRLADAQAEERADAFFGQIKAALARGIDQRTSVSAEVRRLASAQLADTRPLFVRELATLAAFPWPEPRAERSFVAADRRLRQVEMQYFMAKAGRPWEELPWDIGAAIRSTSANFLTHKRVWLSPEIIVAPYLDAPAATAVNYGGAGTIIGHELAHGLPVQVRLSPGDSMTLGDSYQCLERHFDQMATAKKVHFDVRRSVNEYTADLTGVRIALAAMLGTGVAHDPAMLQRLREFFVAFAQYECAIDGDYRSVLESARETHPSALLRINGVVSQIDEFARAFSCAPGTPMAPQTRCIAPWP